MKRLGFASCFMVFTLPFRWIWNFLFTLSWLTPGEVSRPDQISHSRSQVLFPKSADSCCSSQNFFLFFLVPLLGALPFLVGQGSRARVVQRLFSSLLLTVCLEGLAHDFLAWIQCGFLRSCCSSILCEQMHFILVDLSWSTSRAPRTAFWSGTTFTGWSLRLCSKRVLSACFSLCRQGSMVIFCWNLSCLSLLLSTIRSSCSREGVLSLAAWCCSSSQCLSSDLFDCDFGCFDFRLCVNHCRWFPVWFLSCQIKRLEDLWFKLLSCGDFLKMSSRSSVKYLWGYKLFFESFFCRQSRT
jgi:hypothetical protein